VKIGRQQYEKGRKTDPFRFIFCSLSDWPTSWPRRYGALLQASTGNLGIFRTSKHVKNALFFFDPARLTAA
jgi:hypothetical protein